MRMEVVELMRALGFQTALRDFHPEEGIILGGKITVSGENACIVCFHGPSFRDKEWGVFSIDRINGSFSTEASPAVKDRGDRKPTCKQVCTLSLGSAEVKSDSLGAIYRISAGRSHIIPITGNTIENWLMCVCIDYHLHPERYKDLGANALPLIKFSKKLNIQEVLLVPAFEVKLENSHYWPLPSVQSDEAVLPEKDMPVVKCSLTSSFSKGISVTTTVDHYFFLHDVIKGYIDTLTRTQKAAQSSKCRTVWNKNVRAYSCQ